MLVKQILETIKLNAWICLTMVFTFYSMIVYKKQ